jgi:hypothetical protein
MEFTAFTIGLNLPTLSALIIAVSGATYIRSILAGKTRPSIGRWAGWLSLGLLTLYGMVESGTVNPMLLVTVLLHGTYLILALWRGKASWTQMDKVCLAIAIVGATLSFMTNEPLMAITIGVATQFIAAVPTLVKVFAWPEQESVRAHGLGATAGALQFFGGGVLSGWNTARDLQPFGGMLLGLTIVSCIGIGYLRQRNRG